MLEKFLNKRVRVVLRGQRLAKGTVTNINTDFIELDNNLVINIKHLMFIEII